MKVMAGVPRYGAGPALPLRFLNSAELFSARRAGRSGRAPYRSLRSRRPRFADSPTRPSGRVEPPWSRATIRFARGRLKSGVHTPCMASGAAANFLGPGCTCIVKSVLNLQHLDSFERDNPQTPKNAANADGFCLLVFLKMRLVQSEDAARPKRGLEVGDGELGAQ